MGNKLYTFYSADCLTRNTTIYEMNYESEINNLKSNDESTRNLVNDIKEELDNLKYDIRFMKNELKNFKTPPILQRLDIRPIDKNDEKISPVHSNNTSPRLVYTLTSPPKPLPQFSYILSSSPKDTIFNYDEKIPSTSPKVTLTNIIPKSVDNGEIFNNNPIKNNKIRHSRTITSIEPYKIENMISVFRNSEIDKLYEELSRLKTELIKLKLKDETYFSNLIKYKFTIAFNNMKERL